jgi:membrane protease YdiL (CAAX protease family)
MERTDSIETSDRHPPKWNRVLLALLTGLAVVQWASSPLLEWLRPDATMGDRMLVVKGVTFVWFAVVIMRSTGWATVGFRRPVRPGSLLYGIPCLLLSGMALAGGVAPTMTSLAFATMTVWLTLGVLVEEIVFRGVMWEAVAARGPFFTAISTSVGFGMIHLLGIGGEVPTSMILAQMCAAIGIGMVIAAVRTAAGTIWTAVAVHWVFNAMSFLASGGVAETLSPGMELRFVSAGAVLALIGLALVALASRRSGSRGRASVAAGAGMAVSQPG